MDKIKRLTDDKFRNIASKLPFNDILLGKDYHITVILYLLKDIEGLHFKGGTAIQKIILDHSRLSEDVDFTVTEDIGKIKEKIASAINESGLFGKITKDKDVEGFTRLIVHYKGFNDEDEAVFIDLNKMAKLLQKPEKHEIKHFYKENIPQFSVSTLAKGEMVAEKMAAAIGRNKPRDHFDLYKIIKAGIPINLDMVRKKCRDSGIEFDIIKIFNNAKKLKNRWDEDMIPLLAEEISFQEVITTLSRHFGLKAEKEKKKKILGS